MQAAPLSQYPGLQASPGPQYPGINAALPQSSNEVQLQQQILQLQQQLQQQQQQQQRPPPYGATAPTAPPQSAYNPAYNAASTGSTAQPPPPPAYNDIVYGQVLPNSRPIAAAAATAPTSFPQQQPSAHPLQAKVVERLIAIWSTLISIQSVESICTIILLKYFVLICHDNHMLL
jgi:type II secretory pathway pseudopilin PulG